MKKLIIGIVILSAVGCSNPYLNPNVSKAVTEEKQLQLLQSQDTLLKEQNKQLKRIADALEELNK